jgi:hypothetical protein
MSKLETNSIGPWSKPDVEVTGLRCADTNSEKDGVIRYRDSQFQFREDGVWKTLFDPVTAPSAPAADEEQQAPLRLIYAPNAAFPGPRLGNIFKSFADLYAFSSNYLGYKEILFDNKSLPNKLDISVVGADGLSWPDESNSCVIPSGNYDFRRTSLMALSADNSGDCEHIVPMMGFASDSLEQLTQVPVLVKNGVKIKNLSFAKGLFFIGEKEGYDTPPITYSKLSDIFTLTPDLLDSTGYFSACFHKCAFVGGGGFGMTELAPGRTSSLIFIDGLGVTPDPSAESVVLLVNVMHSVFLANNIFSLANGAHLNITDPIGSSWFGEDNITTELDPIDPLPTQNHATLFPPLTGFVSTTQTNFNSEDGGVRLHSDMVERIPYSPVGGVYSGYDPDNVADALDRMAQAIRDIRVAVLLAHPGVLSPDDGTIP